MKKPLCILCTVVLGVAIAGYTAGYKAAYAAGSGGAGGSSSGSGGGTATSGNMGMTSNGTMSNGAVSGTGVTSTGTTSGSTSAVGVTSTSSNGTMASSPAQTGTTSWNSENQFWSNQFSSRPYYNSGTSYSTYQPAYQFGYNTYNQFGGKPYGQLNQTQLQTQWDRTRGNSNLTWSQAQVAARDAYVRMYDNSNLNNTPAATASPAR